MAAVIDFTTAQAANSDSVSRNDAPALFLLATAWRQAGTLSCHQAGLGNARVAKLPDDSQYSVQDKARQVLPDQAVVSLIAFLCSHWTVP